jgi:hypothetical protein
MNHLGGAVAGPKKLTDEVFKFLRTAWPTLSAFNAWVLLKGLETLPVRMRAHTAGALELARWLQEQPGIGRVLYPGLASHPQHALAMSQQSGGGGIVAFELTGGRAAAWRLIEEPLDLAQVLRAEAEPGRCILVDCLTLWLTNLLTAPGDPLAQARENLLAALPGLPGDLILVANETNLGVIPLGELSRRFCDEAGTLHQDLARLCDRVVLTLAGLPLVLKGQPL